MDVISEFIQKVLETREEQDVEYLQTLLVQGEIAIPDFIEQANHLLFTKRAQADTYEQIYNIAEYILEKVCSTHSEDPRDIWILKSFLTVGIWGVPLIL